MTRLAALIAVIFGCLASACATTRAEPVGLSNWGTAFWKADGFPGVTSADNLVVRTDKFELVFDFFPCANEGWLYTWDAGKARIGKHNSGFFCSKAEAGASDKPRSSNLHEEYFPKSEMGQRAFEVMGKVAFMEMEGDTLLLVDAAGGVVLRLRPWIAPGLAEREWAITQYFDGARMVSPRSEFGEWPDIVFLNGRISGVSGCGPWAGDYTLEENRLSVVGAPWLQVVCFGDDEERAGEVTDALNAARSIERSGSGYQLKDERGQVQLVLAPFDPEPPFARR